MAVSVKTSGSQTATLTTEHDLATVVDAGVYQAAIDLAAMTDGSTPDLLTVRIYGKARTSDTERLIDSWEFIGSQSKPLWISPPLVSPHSYRLTLTQATGTGRAYPWAIYTV